MARSFLDRPVDIDVIDRLCDLGRRAPSAGNTQATEFVVLSDRADQERYWGTTFEPHRREHFRWQGLFRAAALILVITRPGAYPERYGEPDKSRTGLGESTRQWGVPFWWVDAGAAVENILLGASERGLGALFFGLFGHEEAVRDRFEIGSDYRIVGTVALGFPDVDEPGRSSNRPRRPLAEVVHHGRFSPGQIGPR